MKNRKFSFAVLVLFAMVQLFSFRGLAWAASPGSVVINEVAWAGSADSANDEWIELYNTTSRSVDLTGWHISDDQGADTYALSGTISANGYYLIEDSESVVQPIAADAVINVSLSNSGDSLVLFDGAGNLIDAVNSSSGAWAAGNATTRATMERINPAVSGDVAANWASGTGAGSTAVSSLGSHIMGTPKLLNSVSAPPQTRASVVMSVSAAAPAVGDTVTLSVHAGGVNNLFSYGAEIDYDPAVLTLKSVNKGSFLGQGDGVPTSFQSGLEGSVSGKLLVAEARTQAVKSGVGGSGVLFTVTFEVAGGEGDESVLSFGSGSFLADVSADLAADFSGVSVAPRNAVADPVTNLQAGEGAQRYALNLSWHGPVSGADKYKVYRMNAHGAWVMLGESAQANFVDADAVLSGGKIVPGLVYRYKVVAVKGAVESAAVEVTGADGRGIKGDNNRSDRVDGRDLENLARHFAQDGAQSGFDPLIDTTYDGLIDGSDLIDLGVSFANVYK
jgi:hypothetical protein